MEITVTGANAMTYPSLHIWNWMVSVYLFMVGAAAGLLVMSVIAHLRSSKSQDHGEITDAVSAAMLVPLLLLTGMFFMWLDLELKRNAFWFFLSLSPASPMSWGGWALAVTVVVSLLYALSIVQDECRDWLRFAFLKDLSRRLNPSLPILAWLCLALGIFLGTYTGLSLSGFVARPLWNSPWLPVLFLASALSNGAALIIIIARTDSARLFFTKTVIWTIGAEFIVLALFFLGHSNAGAAQKESIMPFLSHTHEYFFFGLSFAFITLFVPFALVLKILGRKADRREELSQAVLLKMKLSAYLVLASGLVMKVACVYLGQLSKLS